MRPSREDSTTVRPALQTLTETERHRVLSDELRRFVVKLLGTRGPIESSLGELASDVDRADPEVGAALGREDLLIRLHHVHLPVLDEVGLIEYDRDTKRIRLLELGMAADAVSRPPMG